MATLTPHYSLTKPELSDVITPTIFANNFQTIDTQLYAAAQIAAQAVGACRIETGSYVGTGDAFSAVSYTFDNAPKLICISQRTGAVQAYIPCAGLPTASSPLSRIAVLNAGSNAFVNAYAYKSSDGKTIYWANCLILNDSSITYDVVAFC